MSAKIQAISCYLPEKIYTNEEFYRDFPAAKDTSLEKVGVQQRHIVAPGQTASDMAFEAAEQLFREHGIDRSDIDFLVLCTLENDYYAPSTACVLHGRLGLKTSCGAIDYNLGCSAYVYGLGMAEGFMHATGAKNILLLTTSTLSRTFHSGDRSSHFVFGDAATATLLSRSELPMLGPFVFGTDGKGFEKIIIRDGGARNPVTDASFAEEKDEYGNITSRAHLFMDGVGVFLFTMRTVPAMIHELLEKAQLRMEAIDLFVFHQANVFLNETLRKKLGIPEEKFVHSMADTGNTVQATIPIALYEARKSGRLQPGMTVVLAGFGSGLSWSATIARF